MVPGLSTDYADYADATEDLGHFSRPYGTDLIATHGPSTEVLGYVDSVLSGRQDVSCRPLRGLADLFQPCPWAYARGYIMPSAAGGLFPMPSRDGNHELMRNIPGGDECE